jgi:hypothetical protein
VDNVLTRRYIYWTLSAKKNFKLLNVITRAPADIREEETNLREGHI